MEDIPMPDHICMRDSIKYEEIPPRNGSHRPLWPKYGEYRSAVSVCATFRFERLATLTFLRLLFSLGQTLSLQRETV